MYQKNQDVSSNTNNFCNNLLVSIAIVVWSKKNKNKIKRLRKPWILDAITVSLNSKHELFRQSFTTTLRRAINNCFQTKFTECSNNSRNTWKTLNSLIWCKNTSKEVILNHNGSSASDWGPNYLLINCYFSNDASNLNRNIPHSNISPLNFLGEPVENLFLCTPSDCEEIVNLIRRQKNKSMHWPHEYSCIYI